MKQDKVAGKFSLRGGFLRLVQAYLGYLGNPG